MRLLAWPLATACILILQMATAERAQAQTANWAGFYVGANTGKSWTNLTGTDGFLETDGVVFGIGSTTFQQYPSPDGKTPYSGWFGGLQAGYQLQWGPWVAGIETDFQWSDISSKGQSLGSEQGPTFDTTAKVDFFGTVRVRGGIALGPALFYATGGMAYGRGIGTVVVTPGTPETPGAGGPFPGRDSNVTVGWSVGGGAEYALTDRISLRAEYLHVDLGDAVYVFELAGSGGSYIRGKYANDMDIARMGLNVRF